MAIILKNIPSVTGIRMRTYQVDTYELVTSANSVDEGLTFTITINTANVADGTLVPYTITGVTSSDIEGAPLTGNFVITGGTDTIEFLTSRDFITEGPEYITWGSTPQWGITGYIDDLRITKGVARYTSTTFAPPDRLPTA